MKDLSKAETKQEGRGGKNAAFGETGILKPEEPKEKPKPDKDSKE